MTTTRIRSTKQYKALVAVGLSDEAAVKALTPAPVEDTRLAALVEAGFSEDVAKSILARNGAAVEVVAEPVDAAEALVEASPYTFTKGRVYVTPSILEASVRVLKTGTPEIAKSSGKGRTKAVLVQKHDSGDISIQNLA